MSKKEIPDAVLMKFREAAGRFALPPPSRRSQLLPLKAEIAVLRDKGASFRTIAELLGQCGVRVSGTCVIRFCRHELLGQPPPAYKRKPRSAHKPVRTDGATLARPSAPAATSNQAASAAASQAQIQSTGQSSGPRIAQIHFANPDDL